MKKNKNIKKMLIQATLFTSIILIASCSDKQHSNDIKDVADEHNDAKFDNKDQEKDAQFLVQAAEINLEEIQLGQLAQQKGTATHVKELGKMMETAHTKSLNDLTTLANSKQITIPTSPTDKAQEAYKKLNDKSGNDFDKEYADMMVNGHNDAIDSFEKAATNGNDTDIRNWASNTLPELHKHLDHSIECQKKCNSK